MVANARLIGYMCGIVIALATFSAADEALFPFLDAAPQEELLIYSEYWDSEGRWVTLGRRGDEHYMTRYEVVNGTLEQLSHEAFQSVSQAPTDPDIRLRGHGSDPQREIFEEWSPGVVQVRRIGGMGSGIVVSENGLVVTNRHVVLNAIDVAVLFRDVKNQDGDMRSFAAEVVAADKVRDLALLQVKEPPENLKVFDADEDIEVRPGDLVVAIGHPLGLNWTPTEGTASRVRLAHEWTSRLTKHSADLIQFQTPISPGNSGGPLLDEKGRLVGISTWSMPPGQSINFAVHVSEIKDFLANSTDYPSTDVHDWRKISYDLREKLQLPVWTQGQQCDFENDGIVDLVRFDMNNNGEWDTMALDVDRDKEFEFFAYDRDEDGYYEVVFLDKDLDRKPDYVFHGAPSLKIPVGIKSYGR